MTDIKWTISKEEYDHYSALSYKDMSDEVEKIIPIQWVCGYGYYGSRLAHDDDNFYLVHTIGDSCN